jgi:hypothetical protein
MNWFEKAFEALPDPRTGNAKRHDLLPEYRLLAVFR